MGNMHVTAYTVTTVNVKDEAREYCLAALKNGVTLDKFALGYKELYERIRHYRDHLEELEELLNDD